jgi:hypothetical protein
MSVEQLSQRSATACCLAGAIDLDPEDLTAELLRENQILIEELAARRLEVHNLTERISGLMESARLQTKLIAWVAIAALLVTSIIAWWKP